MRDLDDRPVEARRVVDRRVLRQARRHPVGEERSVVGPRHERTPEGLHDPVRVGHGGKDLLQRAAARPPELVGVGVDHPIRAELGRREPRHPRDPLALAEPLCRLADEVDRDVPNVGLQDLGRAIPRVVVRRDHEIDARVQVEGDLRVDDVLLVPRKHREDELHAASDELRRRSFLATARPPSLRTSRRK